MAVDNNGDNHQPAGRPDGGQYAPKAGQGTDDDLAMPSEVALLDAAAMLTGRREQARRDADATTGDDAWYTGKGRYLGYEYADAIVDAARHADDIPEGTTLTDMAFDDEALAEYLEDMDSDSSPDDVRSTEGAERELGIMEDFAISRMRTTDDRDSLHRAMGFASAIIDARDTLRR